MASPCGELSGIQAVTVKSLFHGFRGGIDNERASKEKEQPVVSENEIFGVKKSRRIRAVWDSLHTCACVCISVLREAFSSL